MSETTRNEQLLKDVLSEDRAGALQEALLGQTLRLARRRRRFRRARPVAVVLAVLTAGLWIVWRPPTGKLLETNNPRPYALIRTQPLPQSCVVESTTFPAAQVVSSAPNAPLVTTDNSEPPLPEINDADLLALAPRPAVLIRLGPHSAELVLAPPDSQASP